MTAPFDRSAAIARVGFLMPGLNDIGLEGLLKVAEVMGERCARDLTPATLAAEQRAREAEGWRMTSAGPVNAIAGVKWVKPEGACPLCADAGRPGGWPCGGCGRC